MRVAHSELHSPTRSVPSGHRNATLFRLAWRNIWRHQRRTALLVGVVAYATLATIFFWGFNDGINASILTGQARFLVAPMMVMTSTYNRDPNPEHALPDLAFTELVAKVSGVSGVRAVAPRLEFPALLRSAYASEGARVRGIDPALEPLVSAVPGKISAGRMLTSPGEVVLGVEVARRLDVRLGERLAIDASSLAGPQGLGLKVVGLIEAGMVGVDGRMVLVHLDDARFLTGVATATGLALEIARGEGARLREAVQAVLPAGVKAYDLLSLLGAVATRIRVSRLLMIPIGLLFALFAALAVTSTLVVSVMERTKEFGMILAIGLDPPGLALMVIFEALLTTLIGWLLGQLLGYLLVTALANWNVLGPIFSSVASSFGNFGIGEEIYTQVSPRYSLFATATIALAAVFTVLVPARRVRTLEPVSAMRD